MFSQRLSILYPPTCVGLQYGSINNAFPAKIKSVRYFGFNTLLVLKFFFPNPTHDSVYALFNKELLVLSPSDIVFTFSLGTASRDVSNFYVENRRLSATLIIPVFIVTHVSIFNLNIIKKSLLIFQLIISYIKRFATIQYCIHCFGRLI